MLVKEGGLAIVVVEVRRVVGVVVRGDEGVLFSAESADEVVVGNADSAAEVAAIVEKFDDDDDDDDDGDCEV